MKLNPQQAPLYGECQLTVELCHEEHSQEEEEEEEVEFYLLFSGTTQRHLTSTQRINHDTLKAVCPAHDCCESVQVTLCSAKPGRPVDLLAEDRFCFVQDLAFDMAQFLVSAAGRADGLEGALLLDERQIPRQECERLDRSLALALRHLSLPGGWSVLGANVSQTVELPPQETLLHFAARRGLRRVAVFLLQQTGGREALMVPNKEGVTPPRLAETGGYCRLLQLFAQEGAATVEADGEAPVLVCPGERSVTHHPKLDTFTLTVATVTGCRRTSLQEDIEYLRCVIRCHRAEEGSSFQQQSELLGSTQEGSDSLVTAAEQQGWLLTFKSSAKGNEPESTGDGDIEGDPETLAPHVNNSRTESGACPPQSGGVDCEEREEGEVETSAAVPAWVAGSEKAADKSEAVQSTAESEWLEEADTNVGAISAVQANSEGPALPRSQEAQSSADTAGKAQECDSAATDMGQSESRGNLETSSVAPMEDSLGVEPMERRAREDAVRRGSVDTPIQEGDGVVVWGCASGNGQDRREVSEGVGSGSECLCPTIASPSHPGAELRPTTDLPEQSQETAAADYSEERLGEGGEGHRGQTPEPFGEGGDCIEPCLSPETKSWEGSLSKQAEWSVDATTGTSEADTVRECQVEEEKTCGDMGFHDLAVQSSVQAPCDQKPSPEPVASVEEPSQDAADVDREGYENGPLEPAFESMRRETPLAENDITSHSSPQVNLTSGTGGDKISVQPGGVTDLNLATAHALSDDKEDTPYSISVSMVCRLPEEGMETEVCRETPSTLEAVLLEKTQIDEPSEKKGLSCLQAEPPSEWVSEALRERENTDGSYLDADLEPHSLSSENAMKGSPEVPLSDAAEVSCTGKEPQRAPESGKAEAADKSELKCENQETEEGLEGAEDKPSTSADVQRREIQPEARDFPPSEEAHGSLEDGGEAKSELESGPEISEMTLKSEAVSVNGGLTGPSTLSAGLEETTEGAADGIVHPPNCETIAEEGSEHKGSECAAEAVVASPAALAESAVPGIPLDATTEADCSSSADPPGVSALGPEHSDTLERVEEVSEEGTEGTEDGNGDGKEAVLLCDDAPATSFVKEGEVSAADGVVGAQREPSLDLESDATGDTEMIHRETDSIYSIDPCPDPSAAERKLSSERAESPESLTPRSTGSSVSTPHCDSGSDVDGLFLTDGGEDNVFRKGEVRAAGDSTSEVSVSVSCSSADDTSSTTPERGEEGAAGGETEEEEKDRLMEVPERATILRSSVRSLSPFRRHSWGPGRNSGAENEISHRSSLRSLGEGRPACHRRSYSLEGLDADRSDGKASLPQDVLPREVCVPPRLDSEERGSLVSLTEETESDLGDFSSLNSQLSGRLRPVRRNIQSMTLPLTKSVSMLALDTMRQARPKRRISFSFTISPILPKSKTVFSFGSSSSDEEESVRMRSTYSGSGSMALSISEEDPGPLRSDHEGKTGTKVSRTFSYLKSKMYKKAKDKDKEKNKEKEKEREAKEKRTLNGHLFSTVNSAPSAQCHQCNKAISTKEASRCTNCNVHVHKGCRENLPACAKFKIKQQHTVPDYPTIPVVPLRSKPTTQRERPRSAILAPDDPALGVGPRRHTSIMPFGSNNLSKSISITNIAGSVSDDMPLKRLKYLSQSTDSLHKTSKVNESTESLTDEGTEMMDSQLMGEFESDAKELEADSWSFTADKKFLKQLKKDVIKRQDVIYELMQTEMHHVRTLKIMADVYSKGLQKEVQLEAQIIDRLFPVLDDLLEIHTHFFTRILERKKESQQEGNGGFVICKIGDVLLTQFSGYNAELMKKVYGKFCSRHNEAVNLYKELHSKDKRFQAFIKNKMSSTIVRRLGIPECILLVTQRITKYPVLLQRILQHTKESEEDHVDVSRALQLVKEVIAAVDSKVNEHEKKMRLKEVHGRTDNRSIMRMKNGQMFAREDLVRGRWLLHDGPLQLKNAAGRLKEVHALLLSDVFVFLQEKDQKYVFALLDQRSTVISLQKLIVREVANEERAFFIITAGIQTPEMVEVHASSKEERNTWMQLIQNAMHSIEKEEDEGIPSETEEDRRQLEMKAKEMRDLLRKKDEQIVALLEEKVKLFRDMCDDGRHRTSMLFRTNGDDVPKGLPVMKDALKEVETLQTLVNGSLGGALGPAGSMAPVSLPRRAETFGGFDSHQMNISKNGERDEVDDSADLRRTESDSVLKKGGDANLLLLLKKNTEQVLHSVTHLHDLLNTLQAVVVQQDTYIEDQRQALSERPASRPNSRPNSLIEQEKQRSLEKQRQEMAVLQRQQAAHAEERRRQERQWEARERELAQREALLSTQEEEVLRRSQELQAEHQELQECKEEYQRDLERLRDAQRKLERDREQVHRQLERDREQVQHQLERIEQTKCSHDKRMHRTPSSTSEDSLKFQSTSSLDRDSGEYELSSSPKTDSLNWMDSRKKGKHLNPFALNPSHKAPSGEGHNQLPSRLLQLGRTKDKKDKKKKKGKGSQTQTAELSHPPGSEPQTDGEIYFC